MSKQPLQIHECDHLRQVVYFNGRWRHVLTNGEIGTACSAGTYKVEAVTDQHWIDLRAETPIEDWTWLKNSVLLEVLKQPGANILPKETWSATVDWYVDTVLACMRSGD